jgi:hypothetical protein
MNEPHALTHSYTPSGAHLVRARRMFVLALNSGAGVMDIHSHAHASRELAPCLTHLQWRRAYPSPELMLLVQEPVRAGALAQHVRRAVRAHAVYVRLARTTHHAAARAAVVVGAVGRPAGAAAALRAGRLLPSAASQPCCSGLCPTFQARSRLMHEWRCPTGR